MKRAFMLATIVITAGAATVLVTDVSAIGSGDGYLLKRSAEETCHACHKTDQNAPLDVNSIKTHTSAITGSSKWGSSGGWGVAGGKYGQFVCTTCHAGHSTPNLFLMKKVITTPNGTNFSGRATNSVAVDFRTLSGTAASPGPQTPGIMGDDSSTHAASAFICEVCHTYDNTQANGVKQHAYTMALTTTHYNAQDCTGCHSHKDGFKPGESGGATDCGGCHSNIFNPMNGTTSSSGYHHYLNNPWSGTTANSGSTVYPVLTPGADVFGAGNPQSNTSRRCLVCHVDHPWFRPDLNTTGGGRANNLRADITTTPPAIPTTTGLTNTDFLSGNAYGGICLSCHGATQTKQYTPQIDNTGTTPAIPYADTSANQVAAFQASAHQYTVNSTFKGTLTTTFNANCSKCHNDTLGTAYQTSSVAFGNHQSTLRRIVAALGITSPTDPLEEKFCYRCHARSTDTAATNKLNAGYDWYGSALGRAMSSASEALYNVVSVLYTTFRHNVSGTSGVHKPYDEGRSANDGTLSGGSRHVSCEDCHNPHAAQPVASGSTAGTVTAFATGTPLDALTDSSQTWTANQWAGYTVLIRENGASGVIYRNTASQLSVKLPTNPAVGNHYLIYKDGTSDGSTVTGAQAGVWGLAPSWPSQTAGAWNDKNGAPADPYDSNGIAQFASITTWNRTENSASQGAVCIKCHSAYAYGAALPGAPSGLPNSTATAWGNTVGGAMSQADKANEFNPTNLGHHALFAIGKNQPIVVGGAEFKAGTATAGATTTVSDTTSSPFTGSRGKTIVIVSGTGQGQARRISAVTSASQVTIAPAFTTAPASGSKYIVLNSYNANWPFYNAGGTGTVSISIGGTATFSSASLPTAVIPGWYLYTWNDNTWRQISGSISSANTSCSVSPAPGSAVSNSPFMVSAGIGNNFVPPFGPWSTLRCSDCHASDSPTDPLGPHGSGTKYLLTKAGKVTFNWMSDNSGTITTITYDPTLSYTGNAGIKSATSDANNFCLNCHRMDLYGAFNLDPSNGCNDTTGTAGGTSGWGTPGYFYPYNARQTHAVDCGDQSSYQVRPKWGIHCMNCHGGARTGGIHGENLGRGGGSTTNSYSGKRLLGGSAWFAALRSYQGSTTSVVGQCWSKGTTDAVDNCGHGHSGATGYQSGTRDNLGSGLPNYDYDSNP